MDIWFDVCNGITTSQAARRLEVSKTMVLVWVRKGELVGVQTPLGWLLDPDNVERFAQQRRLAKERRGTGNR